MYLLVFVNSDWSDQDFYLSSEHVDPFMRKFGMRPHKCLKLLSIDLPYYCTRFANLVRSTKQQIINNQIKMKLLANGWKGWFTSRSAYAGSNWKRWLNPTRSPGPKELIVTFWGTGSGPGTNLSLRPEPDSKKKAMLWISPSLISNKGPMI